MKLRGSPWRVALLLAAGFALAAISTLMVPLPEWRTGRQDVAPLLLVPGDQLANRAQRIWIDTDAACGTGPRVDPDDCLALLLLAGAPQLEWAGVSTVFGNARLSETDLATRALVAALGKSRALSAVHSGASEPLASAGTADRPASRALRAALESGHLTIVALGPLTNIVATLASRPDLTRRVERVIAVMGRRPGHLFHPAEGAKGAMLFGHGPVFRDLNAALDPDATAAIVRMGVPLFLLPYDAARHVEIGAAVMERMRARGGAHAWVADRAGGWLNHWQRNIGREGFYPFDLLAASFALRPDLHRCAIVPIRAGTDPTLPPPFRHSAALLIVPPPVDAGGDTLAEGTAVYCPEVAEGLRAWLVEHLGGR